MIWLACDVNKWQAWVVTLIVLHNVISLAPDHCTTLGLRVSALSCTAKIELWKLWRSLKNPSNPATVCQGIRTASDKLFSCKDLEILVSSHLPNKLRVQFLQSATRRSSGNCLRSTAMGVDGLDWACFAINIQPLIFSHKNKAKRLQKEPLQ